MHGLVDLHVRGSQSNEHAIEIRPFSDTGDSLTLHTTSLVHYVGYYRPCRMQRILRSPK